IGERMRHLLEQSFGGFAPTFLAEVATWSPPVDIEERDDAYVVKAELPGVKREDIQTEIVGNELWLTGELKQEERKGIVRRRTGDPAPPRGGRPDRGHLDHRPGPAERDARARVRHDGRRRKAERRRRSVLRRAVRPARGDGVLLRSGLRAARRARPAREHAR